MQLLRRKVTLHVCQHAQAFWDRTTPAQKWLHGTAAVWVCSNILFNYAMGILTPPGSTVTLPREVRRCAPLLVPVAESVGKRNLRLCALCAWSVTDVMDERTNILPALACFPERACPFHIWRTDRAC